MINKELSLALETLWIYTVYDFLVAIQARRLAREGKWHVELTPSWYDVQRHAFNLRAALGVANKEEKTLMLQKFRNAVQQRRKV